MLRARHPLSRGTITPENDAAGMHISVSREGLEKGPLDDALLQLGLQREISDIQQPLVKALKC